MIDLPNEHDIVAMFPYRPGMKLLVAASDGRGFVVDGEEAVGADPRRQAGADARRRRRRRSVCVPAETATRSPSSATTASMLVVKLDEIPEMARGRGVILQRYRSAGSPIAKVFRLADGLSWRQGENRTRTETDLTPWRGPRGGAGRAVPPASRAPANSPDPAAP